MKGASLLMISLRNVVCGDHYARSHRDRDKAIAAAYASRGYSMKAIGEHFGLHYSMVSRIVKSESDAKFKT